MIMILNCDVALYLLMIFEIVLQADDKCTIYGMSDCEGTLYLVPFGVVG